MKIGSRILKTAAGAGLAMYIAQLLGLNFYGSAGIITILCLETSKRRSLSQAINRTLACFLALLVGGVLFELAGYNPLTFSILILIFLPILIQMHLNGGFITSVVILLHIYTLKTISVPIITNEVLLVLIGTIIALILNSFMPNLEKQLSTIQEEIETRFKTILYEYAMYLEKGDQGWDGKEMVELESIFKRAKELALRNVENHLLRNENRHYDYFKMREDQYDILHRMLPIISQLDEKVLQRLMFSTFLKALSEKVKEENTAYIFIERLAEMRLEMKALPLPQTREEFETRASLFHLMNEINRYLAIKQNAGLIKELDKKKPFLRMRGKS